MSLLTTINSTDVVANSRSVINTNFANLNNALGQMVFNIKDYGALVDGATDDTAAVNAAITAAIAVGGGNIYFPTGTCLCLGAVNISYTGTSQPLQKPLRFTGVGTTWNGYWAASPINGGSILDLRYAGGDGTHVAKIDTRGAGFLEIDHLTVKSGGTDDYQIMQTTNTTVFIHHIGVVGNSAKSGTACVQDFLRLGGTSSVIGNDSNAPFQGYGSKLSNNYYSNIQRGSIFGNFCNSIEVENETFSTSCGSALAFGAPYYFDPGASGQTAGNRIKGGTIELTNYPYMVACIQNASQLTLDSLGGYDNTGTTVAGHYFDATSTGNTVIAGFFTNLLPLITGSGSNFTTVIDTRSGQLSKFPQGVSAVSLTASTGVPKININSSQGGGNNWSFAASWNDATSLSLIDNTRGNVQRLYLNGANGRIGIGNQSPASELDVTGTLTTDRLTIRVTQTPATSSSIGVTGQIAWDASYIYICVAANTWKRTALTTW
ncbi:MAG: glycosyl hydrolase family 28-related protein [Pyrinomonadaceae bacterium]